MRVYRSEGSELGRAMADVYGPLVFTFAHNLTFCSRRKRSKALDGFRIKPRFAAERPGAARSPRKRVSVPLQLRASSCSDRQPLLGGAAKREYSGGIK